MRVFSIKIKFQPGEGVIKSEVIEKSVGEIKLQNKNKTKSKSWALYLKYWASYMNFCEASWAEISVLPNFQISKSQSVFEIWTQFFACELHFYRGPTSK